MKISKDQLEIDLGQNLLLWSSSVPLRAEIPGRPPADMATLIILVDSTIFRVRPSDLKLLILFDAVKATIANAKVIGQLRGCRPVKVTSVPDPSATKGQFCSLRQYELAAWSLLGNSAPKRKASNFL